MELLKKIDLGCGPIKQDGFIGVDRFPLKGVDIIADINGVLPFEDDSIDLIYASHSLEHAEEILYTMSEVYRISKHGAQIVIIAPYYNNDINIANPYHKIPFNEHTPRFWTNIYNNKYVDEKEYRCPRVLSYGLANSDHSEEAIDIRCCKMEYFYSPGYEHLSKKEQYKARKKYIKVCHQIMYHLIVVKDQITDKAFDTLVKNTKFYEPVWIDECRYKSKPQKIFRKLLMR